MGLYLGSSGQRKIILNGIAYCLNLFILSSTDNYIRLLSSDNYILIDSNGIYLIPSDYTEPIVSGIILSLDNYILTDSNGVYLTIKEGE